MAASIVSQMGSDVISWTAPAPAKLGKDAGHMWAYRKATTQRITFQRKCRDLKSLTGKPAANASMPGGANIMFLRQGAR